jgi:hypothetical protein
MPVLDVVFDGVSRTVDYQLRQILAGSQCPDRRYYRFQTTLDGRNHRMDNTSPENIASLKTLGRNLVEREAKSLETLCKKLTSD